MAEFLFKRDANIYVSTGTNATADSTNTDQINVTDFSYNRGTISNDVSRDTLNPTQERTVKTYIETVTTVSFSFTTYMTPINDSGVYCPEENLWIGLLGSDSLIPGALDLEIDFADGNVQSLNELTIWVDYPDVTTNGSYRLDNAVIDRATIEFDINSIAKIRWEGRALSMTVDNSPPTATDRTSITGCTKTKLSTISFSLSPTSYNLALIGGSITIDNNNVFYGRAQLGKVTVPEGHYSGNRTIKGDLEFYTKGGSTDSAALLNTFYTGTATDDNYETNYGVTFTIYVGGPDPDNIVIYVPYALMDSGTQNFNSVITTTIGFTVQESTNNYVSVIYQADPPSALGAYFAGRYYVQVYHPERYFPDTDLGTGITTTYSYFPGLFFPEHYYPQRYYTDTNKNTQI